MGQPPLEDAAARAALLDLILRRSLLHGRFQLASGGWSDTYLDLRRTTLTPDGLLLTARLMLPVAMRARVEAIGGPTLGADPIVAGLLLEAASRGEAWIGFLVRSAQKDHGTGRQIEGHCPAGARVAVIDDVVTGGGSILRAIEAVRAAGAVAVAAMAVVDREQGGEAALAAVGVPLFSLFKLSEILAAAPRPQG